MPIFGIPTKIDEREARIQQIRDQNAREERMKFLDYNAKFRPLLDEALLIEEPKRRSMVIDNLMQSYEEETKRPIPKELADIFKRDPKISQAMLKAALEGDVTIDKVFAQGGNPLIRAQGLLALNANERKNTAAEAVGGTGNFAGPDVSPTAVVPAPTSPLELAAQNVERAVNMYDQRIASAVKNGADPKIIAPMQDQRKALAAALEKMRIDPALKEAENQGAPITTEESSLTGLPLGSRRRQLPGNQGGPVSPVSAVSGTAAVADGAQGPTPSGVAPSPQAKLDMERRSQPVAKQWGDALGREAAQSGLNTVGELEDAVRAGKFRPISQEELSRRTTVAQKGEEIAFKDLEGLRTTARDAQQRASRLEAMSALLTRSGQTGPLIGPVREGVNNLVQLLSAGTVNPRGMDDLQLFRQFNMQLALDTLQAIKGNDSDRDVLNAVRTNPGPSATRGANEVMLKYAYNATVRQQEEALNANRWVSKFGSLTQKDPVSKKTFSETWNDYIQKNSVLDRVAADMKIDADGVRQRLGIKVK